MSRSEFHGEKRQEVTGNLKTDIPTVNVSINVEKPLVQGQETFQAGQTSLPLDQAFQASQTSLPAGKTLPLDQTFQTGQISQTGQLLDQTSYQTRLDENTLREFDIQNHDIRPRHVSSDTTNTNVSNEESLKEKAKDVKDNLKVQTNELKDNVKEKTNDVKEKANDVKENVKEKANDVKENVKEKTNDLIEKANDVKENVKEKTNDLIEKANDVKENVKEKTNDLIEKANDLKENAKEKTNDLIENVKEKTNNLTENVKEKTNTLKENVIERTNTLKENVIERTNTLKDNVVEGTNTLKENVAERTNTLRENVIERTNTLKENVQETTNNLKEKANDVKERVMNTASDTYNKGKEKIEYTINMNSLIKRARYCLGDFVHPKLNIEKQIPIRILNNAFGIVFLVEYKGSFGVGSSMGTGLIIARTPDLKGWTGPCAIGMGGISIGFQVGLQRIEHIIVLRDENVLKTFVSKGQLKLGGDISFAVGPLGRDAQISVNFNDKDYAPIYSYSMSKGLHIGASLDGQAIIIRDDCNESYYGKKVSAKDILFGNVNSLTNDNEYSLLVKLVDEYTQKQGDLPQDWFTNEENRQQYEEDWEKSLDSNLNEDIPKLKHDNKLEKSARHLEIPDTTSNLFKHEKIRDNKSGQRINMDRLLRHARFNLESFMDSKLESEKQIPVSLLNNACGILFLTEIKGGFGIGGSTGTGFIITRKLNENKFSQPCAIGIGGVSFGFQIGGQKSEHILIFRDEEILRTFIRKRELNLGGDVSFSIGPLGRDMDVPLNASDKGYSTIYSYSTANGVYVGATIERQMFQVLDEWNEDYFGKKVTSEEILFGDVKPLSMDQHQSYESLINLIKEYTENKGILKNDSYWGELDRKEEEYWKLDTKDWQGLNDKDIKDVKDTKDWQSFNDKDIKDVKDTKDWQTFDDKSIKDTKDWQGFDDKGIKDTKDWQGFDDKVIKDTKDWQSFNDRDIKDTKDFKGFDDKDFKNVKDNTNIYDQGNITKIVHEKSDVTRVITDIPKDEDKDKIL